MGGGGEPQGDAWRRRGQAWGEANWRRGQDAGGGGQNGGKGGAPVSAERRTERRKKKGGFAISKILGAYLKNKIFG